jgi:hypothetical protein
MIAGRRRIRTWHNARKAMPESTTVFISYSHDSGSHDDTVLHLAGRLCEDGIDARLDRYIEAPPEGWPRWVARQIDECDFVLCVCTAEYRKSFEGRNDPARGLGVNQEGFLILQDLYDHGNRSRRYIPVVFDRPHRAKDLVPGALRAFQRYALPDEYECLHRRLTRQPALPPPRVGRGRKPLATREASPEPLPERSPGFEDQARLVRYVTPALYPLERLAPHDGLFLSRLINPQERATADLITTAWVAARGPLDYTLDSIRIRDICGGGLGANPVVAIPPDAEYRFTYEEGSDRTHALNPALRVGPGTREWAWFTVGTAMEKPFYYMGALHVSLQYQASDGRQGTLVLFPVEDTHARVASIAGCDLLVSDSVRLESDPRAMVVTPQGLQRGLEPSDMPAEWLVPVDIPDLTRDAWRRPDRDRLLDLRQAALGALHARTALNHALRGPAAHDALKAWFAEGSRVAAGLLGGFASPSGTDFLLDHLDRADPGLAVAGLAVRHLALGDDLLLDVARKHPAAEASVLSTLALRPVPGFLPLLERFRTRQSEIGTILLREVFGDLTDDERSAVLADPQGPLGCDLFLRGTINGWGADPRAKLIYTADGIYRTTVWLPGGYHEFKLGGRDWRHANYGGRFPLQRVELGGSFDLHESDLSHNLGVGIADGQAGNYRFSVSARDPGRLTLLIEEQPGAPAP